MGIEVTHVKLDYSGEELRNAFVLDDVQEAYFDHLNIKKGTGNASYFDLRKVSDFNVDDSKNIKSSKINQVSDRIKL